MDEILVSTVVYVPREEVFAFLIDLEGYATYSKYLKNVGQFGDGGPGTKYTMTFGWWRITYRAHSRVIAIDEPRGIDWQVIKDVDARGHWRIEDASGDLVTSDETSPRDREHATRVELRIEFDPDSVRVGAIDLPSFVSLDWVIDRVVPLIQDEAERVLRRIVADLEGEERDVELTVHEGPDSI